MKCPAQRRINHKRLLRNYNFKFHLFNFLLYSEALREHFGTLLFLLGYNSSYAIPLDRVSDFYKND